MTKALWIATDAQRYFLLPEGEEIPPGQEEIQTSDGARTRRTTLASLKLHEVSRSDATQWLREQSSPVEEVESPPLAEGPTSLPARPGLKTLAALTGTSAEDLARDSSALFAALGVFAGRVQRSLEDPGEADAIARTMREHGLKVGDLRGAVERFREYAQSPEGIHDRTAAAERLRSLGEQLQRWAHKIVRSDPNDQSRTD